MEEILFELRTHCAGLNAGRWDYIFSAIKNYRDRGSAYVLPDRGQISMTVPFMRAYTELLVSTCHQRGAYAIGGMSAFIPNRRDTAITERAFEQVRADKRREASDGFDGTWVAHPDLVPVARAEFDAVLGERSSQLDRLRTDVSVSAAQLLDFAIDGGVVSEKGVRSNLLVTLRYLESWLRGVGAAAIDNLMEDVATAEISRSQLWQWRRQQVVTSEGIPITREYIDAVLDEIVANVERDQSDRFDDAALIVREVALNDTYPAFLTVSAYERFLVNIPWRDDVS
jgi:malate synthase